jgi:hypothetical protein
MSLRRGIYIVPTNEWYIERTVWLIAGLVLIAGTLLAAAIDPRWVFLVIATGLSSIAVSLTGFCVVGNVLRKFGFAPRLGTGSAARGDWMVPGAPHLHRGGDQHLDRISALDGA